MKHSVSFRVSAINKVFHNWYKLMPLSFVININQKADKIIRKGIDDLEFKRVYIPKDPNLFREVKDKARYNELGGKWRPLGVPKHAWRLVLHMWNNFLTMFLNEYLGDNQHAYRPRRGALTAWKDVFSKIDKYDYIYEIDLKQCFPSIQALHFGYFNEVRDAACSSILSGEYKQVYTEISGSGWSGWVCVKG
jgi:hypothetical protein